jgi:hypothetical protein
MSTSPSLRSSQLLTTFGPGAMVDLPDDAVLIGGLEEWDYEMGKPIPVISEPRLEAKVCASLRLPYVQLRRPPPANDRDDGFHPTVTAWEFPDWFIAQWQENRPGGGRRRPLVHRERLMRGMWEGSEKRKLWPVVPVRFVRACPCGHLDDLNWPAFVHHGPPCGAQELWLEERGTTGDLAASWITCRCGAARSLQEAAQKGMLGQCNGRRPWLGAYADVECKEQSRLLIRSASNAYFSQLLSVISIPDPRADLDPLVASLLPAGLNIVDGPEKLALVRQIPNVGEPLKPYDDDSVLAALARVRSGIMDSRSVKEVEFSALAAAVNEAGSDVPDGNFFARALPRETWDAPWLAAVERVVLVHRLREVVAQVGFTRFEWVSPDTEGELGDLKELHVVPAELARSVQWVPAIENRGEGIFLLFRSDAIRQWMARPSVKARAVRLVEGFALWKADHEAAKREFPGAPYYMLHTFAHLLMTAISLDCGYPSSSLRERIYAHYGATPAEDRFGVLLYTSSSDAEGTLGGLVEAARDLRRHTRNALDVGRLCSNDPVCAGHNPARRSLHSLLGSACHGCVLVSETSCEQRNELLDRTLIVPTVEALGAEFFPPVD